LNRFLHKVSTYLEVGAGDGHFTATPAAYVRHVYSVDVSEIISVANQRPANFTVVNSDVVGISVPTSTVNVVDRMLEHLHPDGL
jgi:protein-L-isoaspartate O-methyltransferase